MIDEKRIEDIKERFYSVQNNTLRHDQISQQCTVLFDFCNDVKGLFLDFKIEKIYKENAQETRDKLKKENKNLVKLLECINKLSE